jgi:molecular chaperone GrpE
MSNTLNTKNNNFNAENSHQNTGAENSSDTESLAQRSARLEAEAMALYEAAKQGVAAATGNNEDDAETDDIPSAAELYEPSSPSPSPTPLQSESAIMQALQAELEQTKDKMLRAVADAENTKRRALKDRDDAQKFSISSFARDILPVADNLRRALEAIPDEMKADERITNLIEGIEVTERELLRSFERHGLKKIEPLDQIFDPNFHEVMFEAPFPDKAAGTVIQVMEAGYTLHERLIRPARVGVAKDTGQGHGTGGASGAPPSPSEPGQNIDTEA